MNFHNQHIKAAFDLISSLKVSHEAVDVVWAAKQQLLMADKSFAKAARENEATKAEEVKANG